MWFWIWLLLALAFVVMEILTTTFYMIPFAIGAAIGLVAHLFDAPTGLQIILFFLASGIAFAAIRPFAKSVTKEALPNSSGIDRVLGQKARVIKAISGHNEPGQVLLNSEIWLAIQLLKKAAMFLF
ncbi:MAG: NfeD family protein [Coriobacteriia bacterium]|nr:NfeD family protein [Coriobacteriia bacterium]